MNSASASAWASGLSASALVRDAIFGSTVVNASLPFASRTSSSVTFFSFSGASFHRSGNDRGVRYAVSLICPGTDAYSVSRLENSDTAFLIAFVIWYSGLRSEISILPISVTRSWIRSSSPSTTCWSPYTIAIAK